MSDEIKVGDKVRYANTYPHTRVYQVVYVGKGRAVVWHRDTGWFDASLSRLTVVERCLGWEPVPEPEPKWEPGDVIDISDPVDVIRISDPYLSPTFEATLRKNGDWQSTYGLHTTREISERWAKGQVTRVTT